jgi:hypothetical protein
MKTRGMGSYMKITKSTSCAVPWYKSFKHVRMISPIPPITAAIIAQMDNPFWNKDVL